MFFHEADDVILWADVIEASRWGCLPDSGGLDEQVKSKIDDVLFFLTLKAYIKQEREENAEDEGDEDE